MSEDLQPHSSGRHPGDDTGHAPQQGPAAVDAHCTSVQLMHPQRPKPQGHDASSQCSGQEEAHTTEQIHSQHTHSKQSHNAQWEQSRSVVDLLLVLSSRHTHLQQSQMSRLKTPTPSCSCSCVIVRRFIVVVVVDVGVLFIRIYIGSVVVIASALVPCKDWTVIVSCTKQLSFQIKQPKNLKMHFSNKT